MRTDGPASAPEAPSLPRKWVELVRLRSSEASLGLELPTLEAEVRAIAAATPEAETFVLKHALYAGDLAVVVVWQTEAPPRQSREALLLAERLRRLGTVDHAVWAPLDHLAL